MDTLQIIAEPKRRQILGMILDKELAASEIAEVFDVTFGAISQHLAILKAVDLVRVRKDGNRRLYKANSDTIEPYREILQSMWADTLSRLADTIEESADI